MNKLFFFGLIIVGTLFFTGCITNDTALYNLSIQINGQGAAKPGKTKRFPKGRVVDIEAIPAKGWEFECWDGPVSEQYKAATTAVIDGNIMLRAIFSRKAEVLIQTAPSGLISQRTDGSQVEMRPRGSKDIEYIMLHAISDAVANPANPFQFGRIETIFKEYNVESHYVIARNGSIYQFVLDDQIAHHAGVGSWANDPRLTNNMNRYAIGIELLGIGTKSEMEAVIGEAANRKIRAKDRGYTKEQYEALNVLLQHLRALYHIPSENIISHKDYDPDRKWDPGVLFDWTKI